jgi:hypothetical protein
VPKRGVDLISVVDQVVVCAGCGRRWRMPKSGVISDSNWWFLEGHAETHVRAGKKRPPQQQVLHDMEKPPS